MANQLNVAASTLNRILKQQSGISPEMALRLSKALGRSPESWLAMQDAYDLWQVRKNVKLGNVRKVKLDGRITSVLKGSPRCSLSAPANRCPGMVLTS